MKAKIIFKTVVLLLTITTIFSCSSDDDSTAVTSAKPFITTWEITTANETITIPTISK